MRFYRLLQKSRERQWMIKNNLQDFCDSVKIGMIDPNTIIARTFQDNGLKVTA